MKDLKLVHREILRVPRRERCPSQHAGRTDEAVRLPQRDAASGMVPAPGAGQPRNLGRHREDDKALDEVLRGPALSGAESSNDLLNVDRCGRGGDASLRQGQYALGSRTPA